MSDSQENTSDLPVLQSPNVVPNGKYRIRSAARTPSVYLEWMVGGDVQSQPYQATNQRQLWTISSQDDDVYSIQNVASELTLSVLQPTEGNLTPRLYSGGTQKWHIDPRGKMFTIGMVENGKCIDLGENNATILWDRNNLINQSWFLEIVDAKNEPDAKGDYISAGVYTIVNRATNGSMAIYPTNDISPHVRVAPILPPGNDNGAFLWHVLPEGGDAFKFGYTRNASAVRFLTTGPGTGPIITAKEYICRIIPVSGTPFFHIRLGTENNVCISDPNSVGAEGYTLSEAPYSQTENRQQWQFVFVRSS